MILGLSHVFNVQTYAYPFLFLVWQDQLRSLKRKCYLYDPASEKDEIGDVFLEVKYFSER